MNDDRCVPITTPVKFKATTRSIITRSEPENAAPHMRRELFKGTPRPEHRVFLAESLDGSLIGESGFAVLVHKNDRIRERIEQLRSFF
jgi:hypothetical protein